MGAERFEFDFSGVESFDCPCGRHYVNTAEKERWIPVDKELPPNAKNRKALCIRCLVSTKYGVTEGWYNPFLESWYVLLWFMTKRYLNSEIDLERGACPNILQVRNEVNEKHNIVLAWRPLPKLYSLERSDNKTENEAIEALRLINTSKVHLFYSREELAEVRDIAISALEEIQQYRKIGTVEECREAVEKQEPKKPEVSDSDFDYYKCPVCGAYIWATDCVQDHNYCLNCGQAIDWEESEE